MAVVPYATEENVAQYRSKRANQAAYASALTVSRHHFLLCPSNFMYPKIGLLDS
jgi:hypothetical protein